MKATRVEGRVTHRTLLRLGEISSLRESGQLDRIITALQAHADDTWLNIADLDADAAPGFGAIAAVRAVFERLGLDEHFDQVRGHRTAARLADTVFVMVANRLLAPGVDPDRASGVRRQHQRRLHDADGDGRTPGPFRCRTHRHGCRSQSGQTPSWRSLSRSKRRCHIATTIRRRWSRGPYGATLGP